MFFGSFFSDLFYEENYFLKIIPYNRDSSCLKVVRMVLYYTCVKFRPDLQTVAAATAVFLDAPKTRTDRENLQISANFPFSDIL